MSSNVETLNASRAKLIDAFNSIPSIGRILGGNNANFILCEILDKDGGKPSNKRAVEIYKTLAEQRGVVVRYRGSERGCEGCLRVTVGTADECETLIKQLKELLQ